MGLVLCVLALVGVTPGTGVEVVGVLPEIGVDCGVEVGVVPGIVVAVGPAVAVAVGVAVGVDVGLGVGEGVGVGVWVGVGVGVSVGVGVGVLVGVGHVLRQCVGSARNKNLIFALFLTIDDAAVTDRFWPSTLHRPNTIMMNATLASSRREYRLRFTDDSTTASPSECRALKMSTCSKQYDQDTYPHHHDGKQETQNEQHTGPVLTA